MSKKFLVVDIGTHRAQEFEALFVISEIHYIFRFLKYRLGCMLRGKKFPLSTADLKNYLSHQRRLKLNRSKFFYVLIEPNQNLFKLPIYSQSDVAFNVTLSSDKSKFSIASLYLADGDGLGQGSSLYKAKPNVDVNNFLTVLNVDVEQFANQLKNYFEENYSNDYEVILRINNEGAESDAIRGFEKVFNSRFKTVFGSLKDVEAVQGKDEYDALKNFMSDKNIKFVLFHSDISTWESATRALVNIL